MTTRRLVVEPRGLAGPGLVLLVPALSVLGALILGAIFLTVTGGSGNVDAAGLALSIATLLFVSVVLLIGIVERPKVTKR